MAKTAIKKRSQISQDHTTAMVAVSVTSLILGFAVVFVDYQLKVQKFNGNLMNAQDEALKSYNSVIKAGGICRDDNRDGRYSKNELQKCDPTKIPAGELQDSLRYEVMFKTAKNADLESVGREALKICYDHEGKKIDFYQKESNATNDKDRATYNDLIKMCSALRVVSEALPAKENSSALNASLNQIFLVSGKEPTSLSDNKNFNAGRRVAIDGVQILPSSISLEASGADTKLFLENLERSIRNFDVNTAVFEWGGRNTLSFKAQTSAYYAEEEKLMQQSKTITLDSANGKAKPRNNTKGSKK